MDVVQIFIGTERIHVGIDSSSGLNTEFRQFHPFPFGEGVYNFGLLFGQALDGEGDRTFDSV